jgi:hypothetical protein
MISWFQSLLFHIRLVPPTAGYGYFQLDNPVKSVVATAEVAACRRGGGLYKMN